jgi:type IV secretion system protein VirD4
MRCNTARHESAFRCTSGCAAYFLLAATASPGYVRTGLTRYEPGAIFLGISRFDPSLQIGWKDDNAFLTIACGDSGKRRSAIIPNLLTWPGSALVIDPNGISAAVTAARRGKGGGRVTASLGQDVYIVDPFHDVPNVTRASFNPLAAIDPESQHFTEE